MSDTPILSRLRGQHSDLLQGAYYSYDEDPTWDATADAADEIEALRARVAAAEARADREKRRADTTEVALSIANRTPDAFTLTAQRVKAEMRAEAAEARVAALTEERDALARIIWRQKQTLAAPTVARGGEQ